MVPPASSIMFREIANPNPVPEDLVVKFGTNTFLISSSLIPVPLSETLAMILFFSLNKLCADFTEPVVEPLSKFSL